MRRGKRTRTEMSDDKVGVEAEMAKWQQVADMIGGTLDDVCNMAEGERNELVLLISADKCRNDDIDPAKDDDDVLLASSDSEDELYRKPGVYSHTSAHERQVSQPSLKKVKVMIDRCEVDLTSVSNDSGPSSSFNSSPVQNSENSTTTLDNETEINSPIFKKRSKKILLKPTNGRGITINEGEDIGDFKNVKCDDENYERKCLNAVFQKVMSLSSKNKLNDANFLQGTLQPIVSNTEYFKAMDKNPQKYKLDKQIPGLVSLKRTASAAIQDIYQGFEGVKFVKSEAVYTGKEDPTLVSVSTDSSVREGIAAVKVKRRRELESGSRRQEGNNSGEGSVRNGGTRFTRTTRNSINASFDIFDDMFNTGAHDSAHDFQVDDNDYLEELNKKGTTNYKRSRILNSDSDDDFKVDVKDKKGKNVKGKNTKNPTSGTRRNPPGTGENKLGGNDKRKTTRGRGKGKLAEKDVKDENQTSMLNFVGSNRIGNLNANEKLGTYDPMSHLVKLGGDQSKDTSSTSRIYDPGSSRTKLGAGGSSTLSAVERKVSKTNEDPLKNQTGTCPLCLKVQWKSQLEKHAAECSGDAHGTGTQELCSGCLELIPAEAFKDHSLGCNTD